MVETELLEHLEDAETKAWDSLARYKFQMFGYWAAIWVHLNRIGKFKKPNPWKGLVHSARNVNHKPKTEPTKAELDESDLPVLWRATRCISCGDSLLGDRDCKDEPSEVRDAMNLRCRTCAREVCGLAIPFVGTLQHDTGGGHRVIRESKTH